MAAPGKDLRERNSISRKPKVPDQHCGYFNGNAPSEEQRNHSTTGDYRSNPKKERNDTICSILNNSVTE